MPPLQQIALLCHPYHRGGVTRWMADVAMSAAKHGTKVWFVTVAPSTPFLSSGGREPMIDLLAKDIPNLTLVTEPAGFEFEFGTETYRTSRYVSLIETIIPTGTAIIVSDDMAVWAAAAAVADRYPMVGVLHGDQDYYADKAAKFEKQLSVAICVSRRVRERLQKRCPELPAKRIFVIPCGVLLPPASPHTSESAITKLAFIGRLTDYEKRAYDLVAICSRLHKSGFPFELAVVGSSPEAGVAYKEKFKAEGIEALVHFLGWQSSAEVQRILAGTDLVLLTSNSEGMPLVMMEALGAGCGFVGTRVSGIEDYEKHPLAGNCVRVFTVGDTDAGTAAIKDLAGLPATRRAKAARELAEQEFTMEVCLERYAAALSGIRYEGVKPVPIRFSARAKYISYLRAMVRYARLKLSGK